ncbi:MAG TPA: hypothetical protein VLI93_15505 [Acetobacteraceae bacterium]|nr:hypothetical protein [Acetobacteraceae bacterium]
MMVAISALMLAPQVARAQICRAGETDAATRAIPEAVAPAIIAAFHANMTSPQVIRNGVIRCVDGQLMACLAGANLNCGKADTSQVNRGAAEWCRTHPNADFVPAFASGHQTIYDWRCDGSRPMITRQIAHVDKDGFVVEHWQRVGT